MSKLNRYSSATLGEAVFGWFVILPLTVIGLFLALNILIIVGLSLHAVFSFIINLISPLWIVFVGIVVGAIVMKLGKITW